MLKLYGREYCGLCRAMRDELIELGVKPVWVDVEDDPILEERYGDLVPVLVAPGEVILCHYRLDRAVLDAYLLEFR
ncbi:MAG: glutaredoxin family protein [Formivibrio sp.]|nr:glutaredoxin family protein [Formivibrio sp.]